VGGWKGRGIIGRTYKTYSKGQYQKRGEEKKWEIHEAKVVGFKE
jgi:hypothetical protein